MDFNPIFPFTEYIYVSLCNCFLSSDNNKESFLSKSKFLKKKSQFSSIVYHLIFCFYFLLNIFPSTQLFSHSFSHKNTIQVLPLKLTSTHTHVQTHTHKQTINERYLLGLLLLKATGPCSPSLQAMMQMLWLNFLSLINFLIDCNVLSMCFSTKLLKLHYKFTS